MSENANTSKKVLIVDDSVLDLEVGTMMLENEGFTVATLSDPVLCLDTVKAQNPDLVLLDVMMPKMDGNEVLKQLREHYSQIQLPVIMVTSKSDASDVVEALQNGANDYVIKPVQFDVALKRIETQLTLASQSKAMVRSQELEAINSMVVTYNHQINNALTVGVSYLAMLREDFAGDKRFEKVDASLTRIGEIVRMIQEVAQNGKAEFVVYDGNSKMLNMK